MQTLWKQLNLTSRIDTIPKAWDSVCCAQFAASRDAIFQRPKSVYEDLYDWILSRQFRAKKEPRLADSTMALEHTWRLLFQNVLFIAFTMLAMMNVVTGIFVENVQSSAKLDKEEWVMQNARECIKNIGGPKSTINVNEFKSLCGHRNMLGFFKYLDADPNHAEEIFTILDGGGSGTGEIDQDEFLLGCASLYGPCRTIDIARVLDEVQKLQQIQRRVLAYHDDFLREQEELNEKFPSSVDLQ